MASRARCLPLLVTLLILGVSSVASAGERAWVPKKPPAWTQVQKSTAERGVNPCLSPDPGYGVYDRFTRGILMGQALVPQRGGVSKSGHFDLMFHFHGHDAVRKEWVKVMDGAVLVALDLGVGSGPYETAFQAPDQFERLVQSVETLVAKEAGRDRVRARRIGLSAWSAGYGAVQSILGQKYGRRTVDAVVLLDGLHSGYRGSGLNGPQIQAFVDFARRASRHETFMFVSHSSIIPPGYASTTETAHFLIHQLGGRPRSAKARSGDPMGLELIGRYTQGDFHVRGYSGNDKLDHCAHIGLYADVLQVHIKPRWRSPRGRRDPKTRETKPESDRS